MVDRLTEARERETRELAQARVVEPVAAAAVFATSTHDAPDPPPRLLVVTEETAYVFEIALRPFLGVIDGRYVRVGSLVASGRRSTIVRGTTGRQDIRLTFPDGSEVELPRTRGKLAARALALINLG